MFKKTLAVIFTLSLILTLFSACNLVSRIISSSEAPAKTSAVSNTDSSEELSRGMWSDETYTNEFAKLRYVLPEGWVIATDEQLATIMGIGAEAFGDKQKWVAEATKMTTIYDTMVQDPVAQNSISIMFENLVVSGNTKISEEDYCDSIKAQIENLENLSYTFGDSYTTKLNGVDYLVAPTEETNSKISQYYLMHKQDKYMVCVIVSIFDDTKIDDIIAQFK